MASAFDPAAVAALHRRLDGLTPDAARRWGRMTPHQAVVHMTDAFRMALGERPIRDRSTRLLRTVGRWVGFHTPFPWPRGFRAPYEVDQERGGTPPDEFGRDLRALHDALDRFAAAAGAIDGRVHAVFGPLSRREWGVWGYRHTHHHLRQFGL
jgi:hypothetical protein